MEPLSHKILNNQIVSMRKEVRKAFVHQIHGLTQKVNQLRLKKGSDDQKQKNALKADNFVTEIQVLKKLKPDDVSLFALSNPNSSDLGTMISRPIISSETKAIAKLCLRENMQKTVNEFISKYNDSLELLNDLLSERCSKTEKKDKKKKKKTKKKKKKETTKAPESVSQKVDNNKKEIQRESLEVFSDSSDSVPQLIPADDLNENDVNVGMENDSDNFSESDANDGDDLSNSDTASVELTASEDETMNDSTDNVFLNKNKSNIDDEVNKEENNIHKSPRVANNLEKVSKNLQLERKKVDPFFKTSNDSEYYTYCDVEKKIEETTSNSNKHSNNSDSLGEINTRNKEYPFKKGFRDNNSFQKGFNSNFKGNSLKRGNNSKTPFQRNSDKKLFKRNFHDKPFNENLRIKPFNNSSNDRKERHKVPPNKSNRNNFVKPDRKDIKKLSGEIEKPINLHPSWEAKKKLNPVVVPFQGKKIVFDD